MVKKRAAQQVLTTPKAKKTQVSRFGIVPEAIRNIFSPSANSPAEEEDLDEVEAPVPEAPAAPPLSALETQRRVAQAIDERFAVIEEQRADAALKDPSRKLQWNIEIKPTDDDYKTIRAKLQNELREESVLTVVTKYFEDAQRLLIQPPPRDGIVLKIQRQNGEEYRKALAVGGTFEGEKNNLTTKLAMLYFGLPVEAMTLNNILNAGVKDEDDEEDTPDDLPRVQRILYSEKPLQFLDEYHERAWGFPILRRPKSQTTRMITQPNKNTSSAVTIHRRHGAPDHRGGAHLRGGAGPTTNSIPLYGPGQSRSTVSKVSLNHETFKDAALRLLGWDKDKPFQFFIDLYNNQELKKGDPKKKWVRCFTLTNDNYEYMWDNFLKARFTNDLEDWPLRVVSRAAEEKPDPEFALPTKNAVYPGKIPQQPLVASNSSGTKPPVVHTPADHPPPPKPSPKKPQPQKPPPKVQPIPKPVEVKPVVKTATPKKVPAGPTRGSGEGIRPLYTHYSDINAWDLFYVEDHIEAFLRAAQQLLDFDENDAQWSFFVDLYNREFAADQETYTFQTSHQVTKSTFVEVFARIRSYLLDTTEMWAVSIRHENHPYPARAKLTDEKICVYGYRGQVMTSPNTKSLRQTIHQLMGLNKRMQWTVAVDHLKDQNKAFSIDSARYNSPQTSQSIQQIFKALAANPEEKIFIRFANEPRPSQWDPWEPWEKKMSNFVVKLERPQVCTAYWRIPTNINQPFGINQVQKSFKDAMKVLFPPITASDDAFSRPAQNIVIDMFDIGFGGMEGSMDLFNRVKRNHLKKQALAVKLQLNKNEGDPDKGSEIATGIRLIGNEHSGIVYGGNAAKFYSEIQVMATDYLEPTLPDSVRVWKHDNSRNTETTYADESISIKLDAAGKDAAVAAIQGLLRKGSRRANCLLFRPEWDQFIVMKPSKKHIIWHPEQGKRLHHFRDDILEELFQGDDILKANSTKLFAISISALNITTKFVVDATMPDGSLENEPDDEWRTQIFDWFHSKRLEVNILKSNDPVLTLEFGSTPWGVAVKTPETVKPTTVVPYVPPITKPPPRYTKINQPRIRAPRAAPVKTEKFVKWNAKQRYLDSLQQRSYHTDQSVIEPGQKPQAPIYGVSKELEFNVGASFPGVYMQRITPTDVVEIMDENKSLQNQVLERMATCIICKTSFAKYKIDEIKDHCWRHLQQLYTDGACPTCGNGSWSLWTAEEKRQHQAAHASIEESAEVKKFWNQLYCPCCDKELDTLGSPKAILYHMAEHQPGSIQYCDRCGLHLTGCDNYELNHHRDQCLAKEDRPPGSTDRWFCDHCGKDRTAGTEEEIRAHRKTCGSNEGAWCDSCGMDITHLAPKVLQRHKTRCRPPGGYDRKFCAKCGENLEVKDTKSLVYHKQTCFNSESSSALLRYANGQDAQAVSIAVQEERGKLWAKEQELKDRERILNASIRENRNNNDAILKELDDTKKGLIKAKALVATRDATVATLNQRLEGSNVDIPVDQDCEFPGCTTDLRAMTRQNLVDHFKIHGIQYTSLQGEREQCKTELAKAHADLKAALETFAKAQTPGKGGQDTPLTGTCPFPGCTTDLAPLNRQGLRVHFANYHTETFICNLPVPGKSRCKTLVHYSAPENHLNHLQDEGSGGPGLGPIEDDPPGNLQETLAKWLADLKDKRDKHVNLSTNPTRVFITQVPRRRPGEDLVTFQARLAGAQPPPNPSTIVEKIRKRPGETPAERDARVRAGNLDWCLDLEAKDYVIRQFYTIMAGAQLPDDHEWHKLIMDAKNTELDRLRAAEGLPALNHPPDEEITVFGIPSPMKQPRKVRGTRAASATSAPTTKRKRIASATPGPDLGPAPKTPKRALGRPRRKAVVQEEDEEEFVARDEGESEVPLTSPSKRVTRRSPSKRG